MVEDDEANGAEREGTAARLPILSWRALPLAAVAAALGLGYAMGWHHHLTLDSLGRSRMALKALVDAHPIAAPIAYAAAYAALVGLSAPVSSVLTIFAGFLFGWLLGGLVSLVAATAGATAVFFIARSAIGGFLAGGSGGVARRFADGFRRDAFLYLVVLRLAPFIPFSLVNIVTALLGVRPGVFVAATAVGIVPIIFAYAWLGRGIDSVLLAAQAAGRHAGIADLLTPQITIAFLALAAVAASAIAVRKVWSARAAGLPATKLEGDNWR